MKKIVLVTLAGLVLMGPALAQTPGDPKAGEAIFKRCASCHAIGEGAKNRVGPYLTGVVGRPAATAEGYNYSDAMKQHGASGLVWTEDTLSAFLTDPKGYVPGTKMTFPGIKKPDELANVIAYLKTFSPATAPNAGGSAANGSAPAGDATPPATPAPPAAK